MPGQRVGVDENMLRGEVVGKARAAAVGDDSIGAAVQWMLGHASVAAIAQQMLSLIHI